ncbi:MAG: TlpA family protein disulfide reductase [Bacteroidetes bacterium]|jgi:thiol-disulfide isomerase/thioredoxin|nr:TlpA family protein disulfide reductase [Bacteroidota bacterium]
MRIVLSLILILTSSLSAQEVLNLAPAKPTAGSTLTLTYNPAVKGAALTAPKALSAQLLGVAKDAMPVMVEVSMTKNGKAFVGTTTVGDNISIYYLQLVDGDKTDNNDEKLWTVLVHGADGHPVAGGLLSRGQSHLSGRALMLKFERDAKKAVADLGEEVRLYPDAVASRTLLWFAEMQATPGEQTTNHVKQELEGVYERAKENEKDVLLLLRTFEMTGQPERAKAIREEWKAREPKGLIAGNDRWQEVFRERDAAKRFDLFEKAETDFPPKETERSMRDQQYVNFAMAANEMAKAMARLKAMEKPAPDLYNSLAWKYIEHGERLEEATDWAKTGVELARKRDDAGKPPYYTEKQWSSMWTNRLGMILDTYGFGLDQLGKKDEALAAYTEAFTLLQGLDGDVNARYLTALVGAKRYEEAMTVADQCVQKGKSDDKLMAQYKAAYVGLKGSEKGFEQHIRGAEETARTNAMSKVTESMIDKPAPDFSLVGMDGKKVTLSKLKGKVVVVDFWATWCGPCIQSFPHLQKVYEKYRKNPNVVILAVNTWENEKGEAREKTVRKFIADKQYTFPVLFDEDNATVAAYGVEGIPTKFIVDKKGRIRFKDVGFGGGSEMMDKMEVQFGILLKN